MKSVIYARVSSLSDRQNTKRQVSDLTEYASRNGLEVVSVFEEHISGAKSIEEREVLTKCLNFCVEQKIDVLLLSELSRLGRSPLQVLLAVDMLKKAGVAIYIQNYNLCSIVDGKENHIFNLMVSFLGEFYSMEREGIAYRLNSGRKRAIESGVKMGRRVGSTKDKEKYEKQYPELIIKLEERKRHLEAGIRDKRDNVRAIAEDYGIATQTVQTIRKVFNL